MRIHQLSVDDALASLHSGPEGIGEAEAKRRLAEFGPNQVERVETTPLLTRFLLQFTHFFALILWFAAALALFAETQQPGEGMGTLATAIVGVIVINGLFSFWQEFRSEKALSALRHLLPQMVAVERGGALIELPASQLVPGDVIRLHEGDSVPADCRLIEAFGVQVNNAAITGESLSVARDAEPSDDHEVTSGTNVLLAGTALVAGNGRAVVFATGMRTALGEIAHLTQTAAATSSPLQREVAFLTRIIAALATGLGVVFFAIGYASGLPLWHTGMFAIGIIVANVPEGLLPTVTLALAMASQRLARKNVLVKHLASVEALGSATVICTDKTGTLTENRMTVRRLFVDSRFFTSPQDALAQAGEVARRLLLTALHCEEVEKAREGGVMRLLGDPTEVALIEMARKRCQARCSIRASTRSRSTPTANASRRYIARPKVLSCSPKAHLRPCCPSAAATATAATGDRRTLAGRGRSHGKRRPSRLGPGIPARSRTLRPLAPGREFDAARPRRA